MANTAQDQKSEFPRIICKRTIIIGYDCSAGHPFYLDDEKPLDWIEWNPIQLKFYFATLIQQDSCFKGSIF